MLDRRTRKGYIMANEYNMEWARGVVDNGVKKAQGLIDDPAQIDGLLQELQEKMKGLPASATNAFNNVPLMADMVKSYVTREYTNVSPKVIISLVSAFLYLVKRNDIIPDNVPIVGMADDLAVAAVAMMINEPELKAFAAWREQNGLQKAAQIESIEPAEPVQAEAADVPPAQAAATPPSAMPE